MRVAIVAVVTVAAAACGGSPKSTQTPVAPPPPGPVAAPTGTVTPDSVSGYWTGDWGKLVLATRGGKIVGAYSHDDGLLVGELKDGVLVGWWCETPSRKPTKDAGDVEMKFVTNAEGKRAIDGRWRYGSDGTWREDWDIAFDEATPDPALVKRLDAATTDCVK